MSSNLPAGVDKTFARVYQGWQQKHFAGLDAWLPTPPCYVVRFKDALGQTLTDTNRFFDLNDAYICMGAQFAPHEFAWVEEVQQ